MFDDDVRRWRSNYQRFLGPDRTEDATVLRQNFILRALTGEKGSIAIAPRVAQAVGAKHTEIPSNVWRDLPELLADPRFVFPHRHGGLDFAVDRTTPRGEPFLVGVRHGTVHTITPLHDTAVSTGNERLAGLILSNVERGN